MTLLSTLTAINPLNRKVEKQELNIWTKQQEAEIPDIEEEESIEEEEEYEEPIIVTTNLDNILELRRKINPNSVNEIVKIHFLGRNFFKNFDNILLTEIG